MQFDRDQARRIGFVGGFNVFDFRGTVFQIAAGFKIAAGLKVKRAELNLVKVVGVQGERLGARRYGSAKAGLTALHRFEDSP